MATVTVTVPELGENVDAAEVVNVLVAVGDNVDSEQPLIEVETDKAAVEIPSTDAGTITELHVAAGASIQAGDPIVTLDTETSAAAEGDDQEEVAEEPSRSESEDQSDAPSVPSTDDDEHLDGQRFQRRDERQEEQRDVPRDDTVEDERTELRDTAESRTPRLVAAAPSTRRFAREVGVDIGEVSGSGPGGRISIDDVKRHAQRLLADRGRSRRPGVRPPSLPDLSAFGPIRRETMSTVRKRTAEAMSRAWSTVPQVTHHDLADVTDLEKRRRELAPRVAEAGARLTLTAIIVKVVGAALRAHPDLNASVDAEAQEIVYRESIHMGVAVDTEHGLLVPVIRDADRRSITQIAAELGELAERARKRKLAPDELQGATFTVSNLGGIGGAAFSPIVNWPQVGILGVSRATLQATWNGSAFEPRLMLPLSLSYDHRLVDGAEAARFVRFVAEALEEPLMVIL